MNRSKPFIGAGVNAALYCFLGRICYIDCYWWRVRFHNTLQRGI